MGRAIDIADYRVKPGARISLDRWPTRTKPIYESNDSYEKILAEGTAELSDLQRKLYAHDRYALLLIFQAMDAAGKDGAIQHVMSGVNPQGCQVFSFKHPSAEELDHDFLWRTNRALPERGRIGIFNRSYYEEVLIVRVRPEILQAQQLAGLPSSKTKFWDGRYRSIVDMEQHLHRNGTRIVKFFLHISKDEQRQRLLARIDDPDKNWKFTTADLEQRKAWDRYMAAYEACLKATSTTEAPWFIVPADDKRNTRLIVSGIIRDMLRSLDLRYPESDPAQRRQLAAARRALAREKP
ncbi:MAG: ADP-polyphosphate phosphotransferase [Alphaproteobacteria bacterium]